MVIAVEDICKIYRSGRGVVTALDGVSFTIERAENFVIAGKSGSGKTTLLNCLGGLERPDRGAVRCNGQDLNGLSGRALSCFQRTQVGFIFQNGNLLSCLTVRQNLEFPLALNGITGTQKNNRIRELLEQVDLPGLGEALPSELSGGETQRVAFARAIAHKPAILLADEPTANLDTATGRILIRMMADMSRREHCTLVVATHDPEVMRMADNRFQIKDGRKDLTP